MSGGNSNADYHPRRRMAYAKTAQAWLKVKEEYADDLPEVCQDDSSRTWPFYSRHPRNHDFSTTIATQKPSIKCMK